MRQDTSARRALVPAVLASLVLTGPARAQWPSDPSVNVPVCTAPGGQYALSTIPDADGGLITAWVDNRPGSHGVYVQRIDRLGYARWTTDGVLLAPAPGGLETLACPDGEGGAIVAWVENASGAYGIHAQRVAADGTALWTTGGVTVSTLPVPSLPALAMLSDGARGAVVSWAEGDGSPLRVAVQRLGAEGQRAWAAGEVLLGAGTGISSRPQLAPDGAGGTILAWGEYRDGALDVFVQRLDASGTRLWGASDVRACPLASPARFHPGVAADAAGGAIVGWIDYRPANGGGNRADIYAQRFDATGAPQWATNGVQANGSTTAFDDTLLADGAGGAYFAWAASTPRVQHLGSDGSKLWAPEGLALGSLGGGSVHPLAPGPDGGVIVAWSQLGAPAADLYAQSLTTGGVALWPAGGLLVSSAPNTQWQPSLAIDGAGGANILWADLRDLTNQNLFAQHVGAGGALDIGPSARPGSLALSAGPVPARRGAGVTLHLDLPAAALLRATVLDATGRRVATVAGGWREAGRHTLRWDGRDDMGRPPAPGLYFVLVEAGGRQAATRVVVTD